MTEGRSQTGDLSDFHDVGTQELVVNLIQLDVTLVGLGTLGGSVTLMQIEALYSLLCQCRKHMQWSRVKQRNPSRSVLSEPLPVQGRGHGAQLLLCERYFGLSAE